MPRNDVKTAGTRGKFGGDVEITGYDILWDHYKDLKFNQETGWAKLLCRLLPGCKDKSSSQVYSHIDSSALVRDLTAVVDRISSIKYTRA